MENLKIYDMVIKIGKKKESKKNPDDTAFPSFERNKILSLLHTLVVCVAHCGLMEEGKMREKKESRKILH